MNPRYDETPARPAASCWFVISFVLCNRTAQSVTAPISLLLAADDERPVAVGGTTAPGDQTFRGSERCAPFNRNALPVATEKTECRAAASGDAAARSQTGFPRVSTDVIAAFFIDFYY